MPVPLGCLWEVLVIPPMYFVLFLLVPISSASKVKGSVEPHSATTRPTMELANAGGGRIERLMQTRFRLHKLRRAQRVYVQGLEQSRVFLVQPKQYRMDPLLMLVGFGGRVGKPLVQFLLACFCFPYWYVFYICNASVGSHLSTSRWPSSVCPFSILESTRCFLSQLTPLSIYVGIFCCWTG